MEIEKNVTFIVKLTQHDVNALVREIESLYPMFASEEDIAQICNLHELKNELILASRN